MSELHTLCYLCGRISAKVCSMCGRHVCKKHYDEEMHVCSACRKGRRQK